MAHFAELDDNNVVLRVLVVDNKDTADVNGVEKEFIGIAMLQKMFGGRWVQTSYNGNFRKRYAGPGSTYNEQRDAFVPPKPWPSWVLDEITIDWVAPIPMPQDGKIYDWDESVLNWIEVG